MEKRLLIENFSVFCIQYTEIFIVGRDTTHPLLYNIFILICQAKNSYNSIIFYILYSL